MALSLEEYFEHEDVVVSGEVRGRDSGAAEEGVWVLVAALEGVPLQQQLYRPVRTPLLHRAYKLATWTSGIEIFWIELETNLREVQSFPDGFCVSEQITCLRLLTMG